MDDPLHFLLLYNDKGLWNTGRNTITTNNHLLGVLEKSEEWVEMYTFKVLSFGSSLKKQFITTSHRINPIFVDYFFNKVDTKVFPFQ